MNDELHPTDATLAQQVESGTGALRLDLTRRLAAEALGTALLVMAVVGSGIAPSSVPMFVAMQLLGAVIAFGLVRLFYPHAHEAT